MVTETVTGIAPPMVVVQLMGLVLQNLKMETTVLLQPHPTKNPRNLQQKVAEKAPKKATPVNLPPVPFPNQKLPSHHDYLTDRCPVLLDMIRKNLKLVRLDLLAFFKKDFLGRCNSMYDLILFG